MRLFSQDDLAMPEGPASFTFAQPAALAALPSPAAGSSASTRQPAQGWHIVIPVKDPADAKTRLGPALGDRRAAFALAFAGDTVEAALRCAAVASVTVVTPDPRAAAVFAAAGALVIDESDTGDHDGALNHLDHLSDLNRAISLAVARLPVAEKVAVLLADLPCLTVAELSIALARAASHDTAYVPDSSGAGTTLLTARRPARLQPRFGRASASAHAKAGAALLSVEGLSGLRRDVDSLADLVEAARLGFGRRTRELLRGVDLQALDARPRLELEDPRTCT